MESAINVEEGITFAWTKLNVSTKAVAESKVAGLVMRQEKSAKRILSEVTGIARPGEVLTHHNQSKTGFVFTCTLGAGHHGGERSG